MALSKSPLCMHVEQGSGDGFIRSLPVKPKAVKTFSASTCRDVKAVDPTITTVMRRYVDHWGPYLDEGEAGGQRFVNEINDLSGVDILEDLNEATGFSDPQTLAKHNLFSVGFLRACASRGVKGCIGNIAVGNPDDSIIYLYKDAVQLAGVLGMYVGYHSYGTRVLLDSEKLYANRGPLLLEQRLRAAGVTAPIRWLYTECGWDIIPSSPLASGPWRELVRRNLLIVPNMHEQLNGYCRRLDELGIALAFLFTFWGTDDWVDYEYSNSPATLEWYKEHLMNYIPAIPAPTPLPSVLYVTANPRVNIRSLPATTAVDIGNVYWRCPVKPLERQVINGATWYRVYINTREMVSGVQVEQEGWVLGEWLSVTRP